MNKEIIKELIRLSLGIAIGKAPLQTALLDVINAGVETAFEIVRLQKGEIGGLSDGELLEAIKKIQPDDPYVLIKAGIGSVNEPKQ